MSYYPVQHGSATQKDGIFPVWWSCPVCRSMVPPNYRHVHYTGWKLRDWGIEVDERRVIRDTDEVSVSA